MRTRTFRVVQGTMCPYGVRAHPEEPVYLSNQVARSLDLFLHRGSIEGGPGVYGPSLFGILNMNFREDLFHALQ
jgi:hypothetical protein